MASLGRRLALASGRGRSLSRRGGAAVSDQAATAALSFALTFSMARQLTPGEFGQFALLQVALTMGIYAYRELMGTWVLTCPRGVEATGRLVDGALGSAVVGGTILGVGVALLGILQGAPGSITVSMALAGPASLVLQAFRALCYRDLNIKPTALIAAGALAAFVAAFAVTASVPALPAVQPTTIYVVVLALAATSAALLIHHIPDPRQTYRCLRDGKHVWASLSGNLLVTLCRQGGIPSAAALAGSLTTVGGLRGAQSLAGLPLQVPQGLAPLFISQGSVSAAKTRRYPARLGGVWTVLQVGLLGSCFVLSFLLPDPVGQALLGQTWEQADTALPWVLLGALFSQLTLGVEVRLKVENRLGTLVKVRTATLPVSLVAVAVGSALHGAEGAAWGYLCGTLATYLGALSIRRDP